MHPSDQKAALRQSMLERIKRMTPEQRAAESRSVCRRILESLPPPPLTIGGYAALGTEVDLSLLFEELKKRGDRLALPSFQGDHFVFLYCDDLSLLAPGDLKIPEPPQDADVVDDAMDIVLVPARSFDRAGHRLGRGNGGYDRWMEKQRKNNANTQYWGVAFECQIVGEIPVEEHDQKVDKVITARGIKY